MGEKVPPQSIIRGGEHLHCRRLLPFHSSNVRKRSSTLKTKYLSVVSSLRKSIQKCQRMIAIFTKLNGARRRGQGFIIHRREVAGSIGFESRDRPRLQVEFEADSELTDALASRKINSNRLPPIVSDKMKTIVLDLDETLIHSSPESPPETYDFMIKPNVYGLRMDFYVSKRPGVDEFLEAISKKYEVVVFTAGLEPYASLLLDNLDPKGLISHRLYRDSCKQASRGNYVKDLSTIGRDLQKIVIVDDNPKSYSLQPANGIPIKLFEDDRDDKELEKLRVFFERYCDGFDDMRDAVKQYCGGGFVAMAANPVLHAKTKHFELDLHFVGDKAVSREIQIDHVLADCQIANTLTKSLYCAF